MGYIIPAWSSFRTSVRTTSCKWGFNLLWGWQIGLASSSMYIWCVQTKGLMPFKSDIYHPIAFLHLLRTSSRQFSWGLVRDEDITTGHCLFSSRYVYFNSVGRGFRLSFGVSSLAASYASSLLNKGRISSLLLQPCRAASTLEGSGNDVTHGSVALKAYQQNLYLKYYY